MTPETLLKSVLGLSFNVVQLASRRIAGSGATEGRRATDASALLSLHLRFNWLDRPGADLGFIFIVFNQNWSAPSLSDLTEGGPRGHRLIGRALVNA